MSLARYQARRDFRRTQEPAGRNRGRRARGAALLYVIQKHAAKRLHYDFRLALDGVLKSWAVPKGIPTAKGDKRLAMQVEDHPLDYATFEGTIPPGSYGAGTVMIWDSGEYEVLEGEPASALRKGKLVFRLAGAKLRGEWTLVKMRHTRAGENAWLLIKTGQDARGISARADDTSVKSGRHMKQIAAAGDAVWESNRPESSRPRIAAASTRTRKPDDRPATRLKRLPVASPDYVEPMKARVETDLPEDNDWVLEVKLDGIRAIGIKDRREVKLFSRRPRDLTKDYPQIVTALRQLPPRQFVVDGEIVALDEKGRSSFQLLQNRKQGGSGKPPVLFYLFDLINLEGRDLKDLPLIERKATLQDVLQNARAPLRLSQSLEGEPAVVWREITKQGLEGMIGKRRESKYEPGRRSGAWIKVKALNQQEFVIGGYTQPQGSRECFGAILVGYYEGGELLFAAKVGTGFTVASLKSLYRRFQPLKTGNCPFANLPTRRQGRFGQGITAAEMKRCLWLRPVLVCQVKFQEWTRDGNLRQPVFLGLREDKKPKQVRREAALS